MDKHEVLNQLNHIRDFQINDLKKADDAGANFLVCVGCLNATELLGGIRTGHLGEEGHVNTRLRGGIDVLGGVYKHHDQDVLELRHSMVHAYLGRTKNYREVDIMNKDDPSLKSLPLHLGIQVVNGRFVVNVSSWINNLEVAWGNLMRELGANDEQLAAIAVALEKLPQLR